VILISWTRIIHSFFRPKTAAVNKFRLLSFGKISFDRRILKEQNNLMKPTLLQISFIVFRYLAAIIVFYAVAILTWIVFLNLFNGLPQKVLNTLYPTFDFWMPFITVGFIGFYAGSFCLPQKTRWAGSLLLLVLGLGVLYGASYWDFYIDRGDVFYFSDLWMPLTVGGIISVVIHFLRRPKQQ